MEPTGEARQPLPTVKFAKSKVKLGKGKQRGRGAIANWGHTSVCELQASPGLPAGLGLPHCAIHAQCRPTGPPLRASWLAAPPRPPAPAAPCRHLALRIASRPGVPLLHIERPEGSVLTGNVRGRHADQVEQAARTCCLRPACAAASGACGKSDYSRKSRIAERGEGPRKQGAAGQCWGEQGGGGRPAAGTQAGPSGGMQGRRSNQRAEGLSGATGAVWNEAPSRQ